MLRARVKMAVHFNFQGFGQKIPETLFKFATASKPLRGEGKLPATVDNHGVNWGQRLDQHSFLFVFLEWSQSNIVLIFICNEPNFWTELCNNKHRKGKLEGESAHWLVYSCTIMKKTKQRTSALLVKFTLPFFSGPFPELCWTSPLPFPPLPPGSSLDSPSPCQLRPSYTHHLQGVFSWGLPPSPWEGLLWRHSALFYKPFIVSVIANIQHTPQCWSCGLDGSSLWKCKVVGLGLDLSRWDCIGASQRWTPCWYLGKL